MAIFWIIILIIIFAVIALKLFSMLFSAMSKILIIVLVALLVYTIAANASQDLVFQGYVFSDQSITVDNNAFIISFEDENSAHPTSIQVNYRGNYFFIPDHSCKTLINDYLCFYGSIFDTDFNKYKINLTVYRVVPDMTITRTIDNPAMVVGEEAEISVNVTNGIGISAENFQYLDSFSPGELKVTDVKGDCNQQGNDVIYNGALRANKKISCTYIIQAVSEVQRSSRAKITYFDGNDMQVKFSDEIDLNVVPALLIQTYFNETDRKVPEGGRVTFFINMTNNDEDDDIANITLNISLPSGLLYDSTVPIELQLNATANKTIQSERVQASGQVLQFRGGIDKNQSRLIALSLLAAKTGISDIFLDSQYFIEGNSAIYTSEEKDSIEVDHSEIAVFTSFNDGDAFDSGEQKLIKIGVSNPNDNLVLQNISIGVDTNLSNISRGYVAALSSQNAIGAISQEITMPSVDSDASYPLNVIIDYNTQYGMHYQETKEFHLIVNAIEGLSISHDISKTTVQSGEKFNVRINIKNERSSDISNIRVFDVVPVDFVREGLNSISNLNINANDQVTAYEYDMLAPQVAKPLTYSFRTTATYVSGNKTFAFEGPFQVTVIPKQKDLSIARAISDSNPSRGAIVDILYTISNPDDKETLENIRAIFPIQQDIDLIGQKNFTINKLLPGESYTIKNVHRARPKLNGSLDLSPTVFIYNDEDGNVFVKNSSDTGFSADYGYISGPAFFIEKTSNKTVLVGDLISVVLSVSNLGDESGSVAITDSGNTWNLDLNTRENDFITYKLNADKEGIVSFKPAEAKYSYRGRDVYTISNGASTNVTVKKEEAPASQPIQQVKVEKVQNPPVQKKTLLQIIFDAISSVLDLFRGK